MTTEAGQITPVGSGQHEVSSTDCLNSISEQYGFFWKTLWELPENAELKEARKDPNVLFPGDRVHIPELRLKEETCADQQRHRFRRKGVPARLIMQFFRDDEKPRSNEDYVLTVDGRKHHSGKTDGDGRVDVPLPNQAREAILTFRAGAQEENYRISLGGLDPYNSASGVRARLKNLGFDIQEEATGSTQALARAVRSFQESHDLKPTGKLDEETCAKIKDAHGS